MIALNQFLTNALIADEYSEPFQTSKRELFFAKTVNDYKLLTVFKKSFKLDFRQDPECDSASGILPVSLPI